MKQLVMVLILAIVTLVVYIFSLYSSISTGNLISATWGLIFIGLSVISVLIWLGIFVYSDSKNKLPWLFIIALFPIVGVVLYLIFGNNFRGTIRYKRRVKQLGDNYFVPMNNHDIENKKTELNDLSNNLIYLNKITCQNDVSFKSKTQILTNGEQKFPVLLNAIKDAQEFIFIEYYIFNSDQIGMMVIEALIERAQAGVDVFLLYDALGSRKIKKSAITKMKEVGIQIAGFDPVWIPFLSNKINHRNHRKMLVVDGKVAITGGINIGDEYIHRSKKFGFWRDTSILLEGEVVRDFAVLFAGDWFFATGNRLENDKYYVSYKSEEDGGVQMVDSGPHSPVSSVKESIFRMIMGAKKSVYIITPYLIPDFDLLSALSNAALSGVDVRIMVPGRADKKIVYWATQSYFEQLLKAGVRIYTYDNVFCHSKVIVVDENIGSVGTTNMDIRSFYLNFEVNVMLYHTKSVQTLLNDFNIDFSRGTEVIYEDWKNRSLKVRFAQSLAQLFSPIM